jgi:PadR family transcriptional regulator PadR
MYICTMYSKELVKGTLNVIVLNLLAENGRMYGYEIFSRVKEVTDEKILLKDGSLYPALQKLTKLGLLTVEEEIGEGRVRNHEYLAEIKDFFQTMNKILSPNTSNA